MTHIDITFLTSVFYIIVFTYVAYVNRNIKRV